MPTIRRLFGREILDSRGRPTVEATCELASGAVARVSVPSGASTGASEAHELRDGDPKRYRGRGCLRAAGHVSGEISQSLSATNFTSQAELDNALCKLDGTANKARLGANAILAVSLAFARATAAERQMPLYAYFAELAGHTIDRLPRMTINLFSGGLHAGGQTAIQDVLIVPAAATSIDEGLVQSSEVYLAAVELLKRKYAMRWLTADEGGLSPPAAAPEQLLEDAVQAIKDAGFQPGRDFALAVDVASSHFYAGGTYTITGEPLTADDMIQRLVQWTKLYPIVSIEDGLAEEDWEYWPDLQRALGDQVLIVGDDLLCTHPVRIQRAIEARACNGLLLKVNQIGTVTEANVARQLAKEAGWNVTISVRSGDTEDDWFSDLAVGWRGDQTKAGSLTQSERLAKYNRLLAIEQALPLPVHAWPTSEERFYGSS